MNNTSSRTAIVTGASRGIGTAIARRLSIDGFNVVVNYLSDSASAQSLASEIDQAGGQALTVQGDISDPLCATDLFDVAESTFGGVDVLINNAGVMRLATIADTDDAIVNHQISVNLKGVLNGLREAANRLRRGGRIVSFSSSVVGLSLPSYGVYAATKAAVEALTKVLAKELGGREITVNAIAPGPTAIDLLPGEKSSAAIDQLAKLSPLERLSQPVDIANVVSFLVGPDGSWINGQVLRANGAAI